MKVFIETKKLNMLQLLKSLVLSSPQFKALSEVAKKLLEASL